jgi:hypothetical protein
MGALDRMDRLEIARRDGFLFWPGLFPGAAVDALRDRVLPCCENFDFVRLQCAVTVLPEFDSIRLYPPLLAFLEGLLGGPVEPRQGDICRVFFPAAPELATPPHQDESYLRRGTECWTVWTPLTGCPLELGPLALSPGSHQLGLLDEIPASLPWWCSPLARGDALLFHHLTVHRALPNLSRRPRLSIDCRYRGK